MAALTDTRLTPFLGHYAGRRTVDMKAAAKCFKGGMVGIDSSGNAMAAGLLAGGTVRVVGVASALADNTSGVAAAIQVECKVGEFKFLNHGADLVTKASVGALCYVVDDQTVALTNGTATRAPCGIVQQVDTDGVRVLIA
jgi:hypothetical protein